MASTTILVNGKITVKITVAVTVIDLVSYISSRLCTRSMFLIFFETHLCYFFISSNKIYVDLFKVIKICTRGQPAAALIAKNHELNQSTTCDKLSSAPKQITQQSVSLNEVQQRRSNTDFASTYRRLPLFKYSDHLKRRH